MSRRNFTPEFKREAASLVVQQGYFVREACRSLGVGETGRRLSTISREHHNDGK